MTVPWGFNSIKLTVYGDEGSGYPHFHFYKECKPEGGVPRSKKIGGGCICFESANYFKHDRHNDTMNKTEIDGLMEFLKSTVKKYGMSVWNLLIMSWNVENPEQKQLPTDLEIPQYKATMTTIQATKKK